MSDANERWRPYVEKRGFDLPTPQPQKPQEPDRSWMPAPTMMPSEEQHRGIDWWKFGGAERSWRPARAWAAKEHPEFSKNLESLESQMRGLEATVQSGDPRIGKVRAELQKHYWQLNRLFDQHAKWRAKNEPFVRY